MPTLHELAQELGIDPTTLAAKGDVVNKWNGYFTEADTKYTAAAQAQRDAEEKLARLQNEQAAINDQITKFGADEATITALRANYAAMEAQLKAFKEGGFEVKLPDALPAQPAAPQFNPDQFAQNVQRTIIDTINAQNEYQRVYGKALPDNIDVIAQEAQRARKPFMDYFNEKYDIAGEKQRKAEAETQRKMDEYATQKLNEYKEKNPVVQGNPNLAPGVASRIPTIVRERSTREEGKNYAGMSPRQRIAASVSRTREMLSRA